MLSILGSDCPFGPRLHRREVLRAGAFGGALALANRTGLHAAETPPDPTFGCAKRVLLLYLQGAASQFETWDPKPEAPAEIRGQCGSASTAVAGVFICDRLPEVSKLMDRVAIVRSMTHEHNNHSNLYTLSGFPAEDFSSETNPFDSRHHPFFGSVIDYLDEQSGESAPRDVPRNIGLPWQFSTHAPFSKRAGPYASFLGHGYNPNWTEFEGEATQSVARVSFFAGLKDVNVSDPYLGITPESRLRISKDARLQGGLTLDRLEKRRSLLEQMQSEQRRFSETMSGRSVDRFSEMAYSLLTSEKLRIALDIGREPMLLRERYGMHLFGQAALTGRRLLEAGGRLVSVFWDEYKVVNTAWDTHFNHFSRLEKELLPGFDAAVSRLLLDLEERGMLSETLVLCLTEHGRTPKINRDDRGGGRDHWSKAYSVMLAGAGIRPGTVVGASDAQGGFVKDRPVSPEDILATIYHLVGIDPDRTIPDRLGRPVRLTESGEVVKELLA